MAQPRRLPAAALLLPAALLAVVAGCRSDGGAAGPHCLPRVGMTVDELTACGCLLMDDRGLGAAVESDDAARTIVIVNYICPLGAGGIARASVRNGVTEQVFR